MISLLAYTTLETCMTGTIEFIVHKKKARHAAGDRSIIPPSVSTPETRNYFTGVGSFCAKNRKLYWPKSKSLPDEIFLYEQLHLVDGVSHSSTLRALAIDA